MRWIERHLRGLYQTEARLAADGFASPASRLRWGLLIWFFAVVVVAVMVIVTKFPPIWDLMGDPLVLLDSGWRVWNGQVPHRDFYSVIGPYPLGVFGLGFALEERDVSGFPKALLGVGIILSTWSWWISRGRLSVWWRLLFALVILLLPVAPAYLGGGDGPPFGSIHHTTYAMAYNRLGWAAFSLQMLVMLVPRRSPTVNFRVIFWEAVMGGVTLGLCVFCKINFLLGALALTAYWTLLCPKPNAWRATGLLVGLVAVTFLFAGYPGGTLEYFRDQWQLLAVARSESYVQKLVLRLSANLPWLLLLPAVHIWLLAVRSATDDEGGGLRTLWRWTINFIVAFAVSFFVTTFNIEGGEVPGLVIAGLITVEMALRSRRESAKAYQSDDAPRCLIAKVCCGLLSISYLCFDAASLGYATLWKLCKPNWVVESEALPGRLGIIPIPIFFNEPTDRVAVEQAIIRRRSGPWLNSGTENFMTPRQTVRWINDAVELLAPHITSEDRIFVADWYNPFNLALGLPPARGGAVLWDYGRMTDDRVHPDVQRTLEQVTVFLVPKRAHLREQPEFMLRIYGQVLGVDFVKERESQFWVCWRRIRSTVP